MDVTGPVSTGEILTFAVWVILCLVVTGVVARGDDAKASGERPPVNRKRGSDEER